MKVTYHLDPTRLSIRSFAKSLATRELIPSRMKLKENLAANFKAIEGAGVKNLKDLIDALKTKDKLLVFARASGVDADYLTVLKREAGSYLPNPYPIAKLPGIDPKLVVSLENLGVRSTKKFFELADAGKDLSSISKKVGATPKKIKELFGLCDLSRLYGVGPAFARILYDVGISSVEIFKNHTALEMVKIYEDQTGKTADFGEKDLQFSLEVADLL